MHAAFDATKYACFSDEDERVPNGRAHGRAACCDAKWLRNVADFACGMCIRVLMRGMFERGLLPHASFKNCAHCDEMLEARLHALFTHRADKLS